jgi:hypothetical protein
MDPNFDEAVAAEVRRHKQEDWFWGAGCGFVVGLSLVLVAVVATITLWALGVR